MAKTFFDLVRQALPQDLAPEDLLKMVDSSWWDKNPFMASAYSLRYHPRVDWIAYTEAYPDVLRSGMDPCLHFLRHGIYEGRKVQSRHPLARVIKKREDLAVSVAIAISDDDGPWLEKCLKSACGQTLENIEILIAPWDEETVLPRIPGAAFPIRLIKPSAYGSLHLQRMALAEAARGRYIIFLEGRDFLAGDACEVLYAAAQGRDIVACNIQQVGVEASSTDHDSGIALANKVKKRAYPGHNLYKAICFDKTMDYCFFNKLYNSDLVKGAFAQMTRAPLNFGSDIYEYAVIAFHARNLVKIGEPLYFRNRGQTTNCHENTTIRTQRGEAWPALEEFLNNYHLGLYLKFFKDAFISMELDDNTTFQSPKKITSSLNHLKELYGLPFLMETLIERYFNDWSGLAALLQAYEYEHPQAIKRIGIFYHRISFGGVEKNISILARIFSNLGYKLCLFLEEKTPNDFKIQDGTDIYYIAPTQYDIAMLAAHCVTLAEAVGKAGIDLMLYMGWHSPALLWDIGLLHFLDIPVIVSARGDFTFSLMSKQHPFGHSDYLVLR